MKLDVVIPTKNGLELLSTCLPPLLEAGRRTEIGIRVVDDGSSDGTVERGSALYPGVEFIPGGGERGFCHAVNRGAAGSSARFMLLLNNDVIVEPRSVLDLVDRIARAPAEVFSVMPAIIRRDGSDESLLRCRFRHGLAVTGAGSGAPYPSGACSIFRMDAWRSLGGLDTRYAPMYWEDVDIGLRAAARGLRMEREGGITVQHMHAATAGHGGPMRRLRERNRFILMDAHFGNRRFETGLFLPVHALVSILRGRPEFLGGFRDFLAWRRRRI
jgi:GT2 family glycosyltransferase